MTDCIGERWYVQTGFNIGYGAGAKKPHSSDDEHTSWIVIEESKLLKWIENNYGNYLKHYVTTDLIPEE